MKRAAPLAVACFLIVGLSAQEGAAQPRPGSLAEGLVRQRIEIDRLEPPRLEEGLEIGAGKGPLVLLVRRKGGSLEVHDIERGLGNHGPAAEPVQVDEPPKAEAEDVQRPAPRPEAKQQRPVALAKLRLTRNGDDLSLRIASQRRPITGKAVDRTTLLPALQELSATTKGQSVEQQLLLEMNGDTLMQDVLTACEVARAAGFVNLMFSGVGCGELGEADAALIAALPAAHGWMVERRGPGGKQPVCDGELLILLDGPTRWGDIGGFYRTCATAGIWQIAFVGQKDPRTRLKMPVHLPFDRGL